MKKYPLKNRRLALRFGGLVLVLYLIGCADGTLFASSLSFACDEKEGGACEERFDSENGRRIPSKSRRRFSRTGSSRSSDRSDREARRDSSHSSDRSDREGRVFSGGNDLTASYCASQAEEFLEIQKRYHREEIRLHAFRAKYEALFRAYTRLRLSLSESVQRKINNVGLDINDFGGVHGWLNKEYIRFKRGKIGYERMERVIESHENSFDLIESKHSDLLSDLFDEYVSAEDKNNGNSEHHELIVRLEDLLVESCDFVLEACDRLLDNDRLTEEGRRLTDEHDRLWKESVRLLEEFNRTKNIDITRERFQAAERIRRIEERILDEL